MSVALRSFALMFRWQLLRHRQLLLWLVMLQVALGIGVIYGFSYLVPQITPTVALYFSTGAPALTLILLGLSLVPQEVAQARLSGRLTYVSALPIPRLVPMLSEVAFWVLVQLPGAIVTLLLAVVRFHIHLHISVLILPAVILVALTTSAVGYAMAVTVPPAATNQVASFLSIVLLLFSPINFPLQRLPVWLQDVHRVLPITYMADIIRGGLTAQYGPGRGVAFGVVIAWCAAGLAISAYAASKRA